MEPQEGKTSVQKLTRSKENITPPVGSPLNEKATESKAIAARADAKAKDEAGNSITALV